MRSIRYLIISVSAALAVLNVGVSLSNFAENEKLVQWMTHAEGNLYFQLSAAHLVLAFLFVVLAVEHWRDRGRRFIALVASIGVVCVYVWWYLEKFMFLYGQGLSRGTAEYETLLADGGIFRRASLADHIAIPLSLIVVALVFVLHFRKTPSGEMA
jgi:hypothetical protein